MLGHPAHRTDTGQEREIPVTHDGTVNVNIGGDQWTDGRVGRYITIPTRVPLLTAGDAREVGYALIAAADELDVLSDLDASISE